MSEKVIIIAEAGVNHNGSIQEAKKLIDAAKKSNADYVKFQSFDVKELVTKKAKKSSYQVKSTKKDKTLFNMLSNLMLKKKDIKILIEYSKKKRY
tara:strand:- start:134 stop:418 length:285 start_codon:yes stop_codon:yes gene_type:complete